MKQFLEAYESSSGVYQLTSYDSGFEEAYIDVRILEGRLHPDEIVEQLPYLPKGQKHYKEWRMRQGSTRRILDYLSSYKNQNILDLGCGNGWCSHQLVQNGAEVLGLDVNQKELEQAAKLFGRTDCFFAYGDVFEIDWPSAFFDQIILNSCVQYFSDIQKVVSYLLTMLQPNGSIHILDSPIYEAAVIAEAKARTKAYFKEKENSRMETFYHHHSWEDIAAFKYEIRYNPKQFCNKIKRRWMGGDSPFPWIIIRK